MKNKFSQQEAEYKAFLKAAKATPLGQKILAQMANEKRERWINDISPEGKIIGRLEFFSGKYEKL